MARPRCLAAALVAMAASSAFAQGPIRTSDPQLDVVGITAPSQEATLASVRPARIADLLAEEGAAVSAGDVVIALDDAVQAARTEIARAKAASTLRVELADQRFKQAQRKVDRLQAIHGEKFAASKEADDAMTAAAIARLNYELEAFEHTQAKLAFEYEERILEDFRIRAPFDGYVTRHLKHVGETVDQHEGIVTIVQVDPLDVLLDCPTDLALLVMTGDEYMVTPLDHAWPAQPGTVTFVSPVIHTASQTFQVRLSVSNADDIWLAGMKVSVNFAAPLSSSTDRHTAGPRPPFFPVLYRE